MIKLMVISLFSIEMKFCIYYYICGWQLHLLSVGVLTGSWEGNHESDRETWMFPLGAGNAMRYKRQMVP